MWASSFFRDDDNKKGEEGIRERFSCFSVARYIWHVFLRNIRAWYVSQVRDRSDFTSVLLSFYGDRKLGQSYLHSKPLYIYMWAEVIDS